MVPFSESIEGGMTGTQPICWVHCQTKEYEVEPAEDYDGEMRALSLNLSMDVEMKLWEERNVELLADVYSLETNLASSFSALINAILSLSSVISSPN